MENTKRMVSKRVKGKKVVSFTPFKRHKSFQSHFEAGCQFYSSGKTDEAIEHFRRAAALDRRDPESRIQLGLAYASKGQYEAAVSYLKRGVELNPKDLEAYFHLGMAFFYSSNVKEAVRVWKKGLILQPADPDLHLALAEAYLILEQYPRAHEHAGRILEANAKNIEALNLKGKIFIHENRTDAALEVLRKAKHLNPYFPQTYLHLGMVYVQMGLLDAAVMQFNRALRLAPGNAEVYVNLGHALWHKGEPAKALEAFAQASKIDPEDREALYFAGIVHEELKAFREAERCFRQALLLDSNFYEARKHLEEIQEKLQPSGGKLA